MTDRTLALKAHRLSQKEGMDGPTLAKELGVKYAKEAWHLAAFGRSWSRIDRARLTAAGWAVVQAMEAN